jgi:PIN domain nuclease of toxin-antitoxin system
VALLDAYAIVALVIEEPAGAEVEEIIRSGECAVVVTNLAEAIFTVRRTHRWTLEQTSAVLDPMFLTGVLRIVSSSEEDAWQGAELRVKHYDRKTRAVSLADCFLLAHGLAADDVIATADQPLASAAAEEGVRVIGLPDTTGARPSG